MTEQDVQTGEHSIARRDEPMAQLTEQDTEIEERSGELKGIRILLAVLLLPQQQDERLLD